MNETGLPGVIWFFFIVIMACVTVMLFSRQAKKKTEDSAPAIPVPPLMHADLPPFDAPVAIGERFHYLGLEMLCLGHQVTTPGAPPWMALNGIRCEYVAGDGALRSWCFYPSDMAALRAEIERARTTTT